MKRRLLVWAGALFALAALAMVVVPRQERADAQMPPPPPASGPHPNRSASSPPEVAPLVATRLLEHAARLRLKPEQVIRLRTLARQFREPLRRAVRAHARATDRLRELLRKGSRQVISLAEVQRLGEETARRLKARRALEQRERQAALRILHAAQRRAAAHLLAEADRERGAPATLTPTGPLPPPETPPAPQDLRP